MTFKRLLVQSGADPKTLKELRELVRQDKAEKYRNGTYVSKKAPEHLTGKLDLHPNGFGFLSLDEGERISLSLKTRCWELCTATG